MHVEAETDLGLWYVGVTLDVDLYFEPSDRSVGIPASLEIDSIDNVGITVGWYDDDINWVLNEWVSKDTLEIDKAIQVIRALNNPLFDKLEQAIDDAIDNGISSAMQLID